MKSDSDKTRLIFVLGPSGVGKSTIGDWVAEDLHLLHIEVDRWPDGDGIDIAGLRAEWNVYWHDGSVQSLVRVLHSRAIQAQRSGTVLTFPGNLVLPDSLINVARVAGVTVVVLYGSGAECLGAFLSREERTGRRLSIDHWIENNRDAYAQFSRPEYAEWRLAVFECGDRRSRVRIVGEIRARLAAG